MADEGPCSSWPFLSIDLNPGCFFRSRESGNVTRLAGIEIFRNGMASDISTPLKPRLLLQVVSNAQGRRGRLKLPGSRLKTIAFSEMATN
jgi:hypothetical protein